MDVSYISSSELGSSTEDSSCCKVSLQATEVETPCSCIFNLQLVCTAFKTTWAKSNFGPEWHYL